MRESAHSQAGFNATESQRWSQAASEKRDTNWKFCFDAGSPASPGTREEEEEGLPALALLPCVCLHAGLSSAGDPGRGMQQLLSKCGVTCCARPDRATRGWHGRTPKRQRTTRHWTRKPVEDGWHDQDAMKGPRRMTVHHPKMSVGKKPIICS